MTGSAATELDLNGALKAFYDQSSKPSYQGRIYVIMHYNCISDRNFPTLQRRFHCSAAAVHVGHGLEYHHITVVQFTLER